jgi:hypothetical protein
MGRRKQPYRTGGPSKDKTRHNSPYWCKWRELVTDKNGSREVNRIQWFSSLKDAEEHGKRVTGNRADVRDFTDTERLQAVHFFRECETRGLTPLDVFTAGLKHYGAEAATDCTISDACEYWCTWMTGEDYSPKTINGYESSIKWLMRQTDQERLTASYTAPELVALVKGRYSNHTSRLALLRDFKSFFSWAARQGYCTAELSRKMALDPHKTKSSALKSSQRRTHQRPPRLRADQIVPMFAAVEPRYHPALALAVFAGLRPESELPNIEWRATLRGHTYGIDFESRTISLPVEWSEKTRMERTLHDLPEPLWKILAAAEKKTGRVAETNYTNWRKSVITPIKAALGMDTWPHDVLRHTALSFQNVLAGQAITMNNAGHTNPKTFYQRYNNAVGKKEAEDFQSLEI